MTQPDRFLSAMSFSLALHGFLICGLAFVPRLPSPSQSGLIEFSLRPHRSRPDHRPRPKPMTAEQKSAKPRMIRPVVAKSAVRQPVQNLRPRRNSRGYGLSPKKTQIQRRLHLLADSQPPRYPAIARLLKKEGEVTFSYTVSASGKIEDVKLVAYTGHASFVKAAEEALRKQKFAPPGRRVEKVLKTFAFRL